MDQVIEQMLRQHNTQTIYDKKNSIKEVLQEIILCGLSRAGFFKSAAFYGGTALRIFYGLDRFSEDLDFSLKEPSPLFDFAEYLPMLEKEIRAYGLNFYDYVFYLSRGIAVNLNHLAARLVQSSYLSAERKIAIEDVKDMLRKRFASIDYAQAKQDVEPFIKIPGALAVWKADFLSAITDDLKTDI